MLPSALRPCVRCHADVTSARNLLLLLASIALVAAACTVAVVTVAELLLFSAAAVGLQVSTATLGTPGTS
jgi:hypothetical protein